MDLILLVVSCSLLIGATLDDFFIILIWNFQLLPYF